jgi:hypothetical protein
MRVVGGIVFASNVQGLLLTMPAMHVILLLLSSMILLRVRELKEGFL